MTTFVPKKLSCGFAVNIAQQNSKLMAEDNTANLLPLTHRERINAEVNVLCRAVKWATVRIQGFGIAFNFAEMLHTK